MRVVIIEDEFYTAEYLKELISQVAPDIEIVSVLSGVSDAQRYLGSEVAPDLIFCDVHLGDGSGFDIFSKLNIKAPVIFVTAFDQYALQAFKANGIDYILKPFNANAILESVNKFRMMYASRIKRHHVYDDVPQAAVYASPTGPSSILVKFGEKIKPVKIKDIAYIKTEHKWVQLVTFHNEVYSYNKTLEDMEHLCGQCFYRVNRQVLLNRDAIDEVLQTYSRKLLLQLRIGNAPTLEINKSKMSHFLNWLSA